MWDKLVEVHRGDTHILEVKVDGLKGKYDVMRMQDHEIIVYT